MCLSLTTSAYDEIVVKKPTVTDTRLVRNAQLRLPQIVICTANPDNDEMKYPFPDSIKDEMLLVGSLAFNPFFGIVRQSMQKNISRAFETSQFLEETNQKFAVDQTSDLLDQYCQLLIFSCFFCPNSIHSSTCHLVFIVWGGW